MYFENKVAEILSSLNCSTQSTEKNQLERIDINLQLVKSHLKLMNTVSELEKVVQEVKNISLTEEKVETCSDGKVEENRIMIACKSVAEIESKFPEFSYDEGTEKVVCQICKQDFNYDISLETGRNQSQSLVHLKSTLKTHLLKSDTHNSALQTVESQEKIEGKEETRNSKCGMNLGRTSYYLLSKGRPNSDFTPLLAMQHSNGCDIGDINHSTDFVKNISKSFSSVITGRLQKHFGTRLTQTGCLPPCKVVEDGATYKHNTRHLIGLTSVFPGDKPLIQSVFCGAPKGVNSDAISTAKNMATVISKYMVPEQYLGTSMDGANFLGSVGEHLDSELGKTGHHDWDGVHAAATIDTGLRNPKKPWAKQFSWLNETTSIISKANKFINWGQEFDRFFRTSKAMIEEGYDLKCNVPQFFSETRFANYCVKIYLKFR